MDDLFSAAEQPLKPLAERMRPTTLDDFLGQEHLVGKGKLLRRAIEADRMTSAIFFGPPGCGKTTLAAVIAQSTRAAFAQMNAVTSGVADLRAVLKEAEDRRKLYGQSTYLLLDECHRWNKAQSDCVLPAIEKGIVRFIGSTTENPSVAMTPAIVSRCRVFRFEPLTQAQVQEGMRRALADKSQGFGQRRVEMTADAMVRIAQVANGDVRSALNALELAVLTTPPDEDGVQRITLAVAEESIQKPVIRCDESLYYDMLSAFCKSLRGSDSDAALAWFARLNYAGVDPRIVVRRLIAHASEDVGLANPAAMLQAVAASQALEFIGMPEAKLPIAQAIIAVCESPKSNSVVTAISAAMADAEKGGFGPVPPHLRDTNYPSHDRIQAQYKYPHDYPGHWLPQAYMPPEVEGRRYYLPSDQGAEAKLQDQHRRRGKAVPGSEGGTLGGE
ncbi:MAG: replication-associated recombination protein A [Oscillospiraceae bacterium]|jgi:putative ATPase|nr:replication-associated recombination protein A [Oscillospiraceae bacterium]